MLDANIPEQVMFSYWVTHIMDLKGLLGVTVIVQTLADDNH